LLTGESVPVSKHVEPLPEKLDLADRKNMAFAATTVASGRGQGAVIAIGGMTELGKIASQIRSEPAVATPLQERMTRFTRAITLAVAFASVAAFALGVLVGESVVEMFLVAVALAVAAIPEGLPVTLTITLAVGVRRMARRRAIIRRLAAVE